MTTYVFELYSPDGAQVGAATVRDRRVRTEGVAADILANDDGAMRMTPTGLSRDRRSPWRIFVVLVDAAREYGLELAHNLPDPPPIDPTVEY